MNRPATCVALIVALGVAAASIQGEDAVVAYPRVPGDAANADYVSVTVNGIPVETVATDTGVGYAHFASTGRVRIEIVSREPISKFDLSPHRLAIPARADGNVLAFEIEEPRKLHLRINGLSRFFIFADPLEQDIPLAGTPGVRSFADFGVSSDPSLVQTAAIQRAIDDTAAASGVLRVDPGVYLTGRLTFPSNLSLYLAPGAVLRGTGRMEDYARGRGETQQIQITDATNVRIFGRGVIDGHGQELRRRAGNTTESRARLISTERARGFSIDDVILRGAGVWCVHSVESEHLRFSNVKIVSQTRAEWDGPTDSWEGSNTDGFDPDNSSHVLIENCFISCDDDAIAVKLRSGARRDMGDIVFRGNVVWTMCSALKIGTEIVGHTVRDVVFEGNDVVNADVGIAVWCWRGGTVEGARWVDNHFEAIGIVPKESPHKKETNIRLTIRNVNNHGRGHVRDLLIKDNTFERFSPNDSMMQGLDDEHLIDGVVFDNLVIAGRKRLSDEDARMTVSRFTRNIVFR